MALTTHFGHTQTTLLPLPPLKAGQTIDSIAERGMSVALALLHDKDYMMNLSPFHVGHEEIPASAQQAVNVDKLATQFKVALAESETPKPEDDGAEWQHYEIRDQVPVLFSYKKQITFRAALRNTPTGMESLTDPGNTVTIHGRFDVSRTSNDPLTLTLVERTATCCNLVLSWYIRSNLGSSHADIHKTIKARFVEEMQKSS